MKSASHMFEWPPSLLDGLLNVLLGLVSRIPVPMLGNDTCTLGDALSGMGHHRTQVHCHNHNSCMCTFWRDGNCRYHPPIHVYLVHGTLKGFTVVLHIQLDPGIVASNRNDLFFHP